MNSVVQRARAAARLGQPIHVFDKGRLRRDVWIGQTFLGSCTTEEGEALREFYVNLAHGTHIIDINGNRVQYHAHPDETEREIADGLKAAVESQLPGLTCSVLEHDGKISISLGQRARMEHTLKIEVNRSVDNLLDNTYEDQDGEG